MHVMDCSCAPILWFFYAASDGATAKRIPNHIFWSIFTSLCVNFFTSLWKDSVAMAVMHRFGRCFH